MAFYAVINEQEYKHKLTTNCCTSSVCINCAFCKVIS